MKKVTLLVAGIALFAMASCKKDYTCECTSNTNGVEADAASITIKETKKKAKVACEATSGSATVGSTTIKTTCKLKD